jgi:hypothetical protein
MEMINYQNNDKFPEQLKTIIEKIFIDIDNNVYKNNKDLLSKSPYGEKIVDLVKDRFKLNVVIDKEFSEYYMAAVIPFMSDYLSEGTSVNNLGFKILNDLLFGINIHKHYRQIEKERETYFNRIHNRKGFVDIKNARVGGYLADVKNYLLINFFMLREEQLTPGEVTAVIVHELGHAFSGLESHHNLQTTNATIVDILNDINKNKSDKALYTFKKRFDEKDIENVSLNNSKEVVDFYGKLANIYLGELNSQMVNNKYDETTFENMADSFAVRFNLGSELVTGLNKLHDNYGAIGQLSSFIYWSMVLVDFILLAIALILLGPIGSGVFLIVMAALVNLPNGHMTYDVPLDRYNRIKNGIVNNLKNKKLPKELMTELIHQFELIDGIMKETVNHESLVMKIFGTIDFVNKTDNYYIELQQTIENSLNNALFVKSAKLSLI